MSDPNTMVPTLEAIKGGGGSIKVGTTGTISALMSKELESASNSSPALSVSSEATTPRKSKFKKMSIDIATSSSSSAGGLGHLKDPEAIVTKRTRQHTVSQIPILVAGDVSVDATPIRQKYVKKQVGLVPIVDIKCGSPDRAWMKSGLKKLGFSKLSDGSM